MHLRCSETLVGGHPFTMAVEQTISRSFSCRPHSLDLWLLVPEKRKVWSWVHGQVLQALGEKKSPLQAATPPRPRWFYKTPLDPHNWWFQSSILEELWQEETWELNKDHISWTQHCFPAMAHSESQRKSPTGNTYSWSLRSVARQSTAHVTNSNLPLCTGEEVQCFSLPFQTANKYYGRTVTNINKNYISQWHFKKNWKCVVNPESMM